MDGWPWGTRSHKRASVLMPDGRVLPKMNRAARFLRVRDLKREIRREHKLIREKRQEWMEHIRNCGKALNEAQFCKNKNIKWEDWVKKNCPFSYETARIYQRVANNWEHPRIQELRDKGETFDSLRKFMDAIRNKKDKPKPEPDPELDAKRRELLRLIYGDHPPNEEEIRSKLLSRIGLYLTKLGLTEVMVLEWNLTDPHFGDGLLDQLHEKLKSLVNLYYEGDYYATDATQWEDEKMRREVAKRTHRALNERRRISS